MTRPHSALILPRVRSQTIVAAIIAFLSIFSTTNANDENDSVIHHLFVPSTTNSSVDHIELIAEGEQLHLKESASLPLPFAPKSLAWNDRRSQMIATTGGDDSSMAATIQWDTTLGLQLIQTKRLDQPSGYTSFDRTGRFFLTANYRTGIIASYRLATDGHLEMLASIVHTPTREAHCVHTTPDNRFTYVPCVKTNNALYQYSFDAETGRLTPIQPINANPPALFGPRHCVYHPTLPIAYFSNEQQLGVSVYEYDQAGRLHDRQHATTLPRRSPYVKGKRGLHASDLTLTRDAKFLFVAVRDFVSDEDSVYTFTVQPDGRLRLASRKLVGDIPWKLNLTPDDRWLLVSETGDQQLAAYRIGRDGQLTPAATLEWQHAPRDMIVPSLPAVSGHQASQ
ncbi:lactonase family protein [Rhodopirellula halodulae]|uniref:lactonase family protein n=1 Tax=Rhodopirellula halodulae TaxID=2894198 RepID=UPI001E3E15A7|nr:beta-propeller fold lactonase family protein [Rhodopirellula sp. JC737]